MDAESFLQDFRISKTASDQDRHGGSAQSVNMLLKGQPEYRKKAPFSDRMESPVEPFSRAASKNAQLISAKESVLVYQSENPNIVVGDHQTGWHRSICFPHVNWRT